MRIARHGDTALSRRRDKATRRIKHGSTCEKQVCKVWSEKYEAWGRYWVNMWTNRTHGSGVKRQPRANSGAKHEEAKVLE